MNMLYRGTNLHQATTEEFRDRSIHANEFDIYSGWMDPQHAQEDHSGEYVADLPWDDGPRVRTESIAGGISVRMGAAQSFADGPVPVLLYLKERRVNNVSPLGYSYQDFDAMRGTMPHYDGTATAELRVNDDLKGLLNCNDGRCAIKYYGDTLKRRAQAYEEEMERVSMTGDINISGAVQAVATFALRPVSNVASLEGYSLVETKMTPKDDTIVKEWSDEQAMEVLHDELAKRAPADWDTYAIQVNAWLVQESWGYRERDIEAVYGPNGKVPVSSVPAWLLGEA